ncbi:hypothetical protein C6I20_15745 [Aeromicrobium sp. A1-2]|uniref:DUF3558 domain-containing protein n=1 Tax=Aeromicrobium sp. A1-2 TaxID=2107713 RepID=UPI000E4A4894|nr:DUF3558 domain-containing protein [Aeromicrobium sp. A1-2]AXT86482.1 hypothetical protein C6I20_15745 [Aeromicrobium sp. A1-2]
MRRALTLAGAAVLLLSGCGGSNADSASPTPTTASGSPAAIDPAEPACGFLTPPEREALIGSAIDEVVATGGSNDSSLCRWQAATALLQVTTLPAREWAKTLPDVVAQLEKSGTTSGDDAKDLARAKKLLTGADSFSDAEACAAFTTLAEIGGADKGATTTIATVPITETESGLSGQICSGGELTSILYSVPDLERTTKVEAAVQKALKAAQARAVAAR